MEIQEKEKIPYTGVYILVLYTVTLLRSIGAWSLVPSIIDSVIFNLIGLVGGLILLKELIDIMRKKRRFDYDWLLLGFLIVFGVSILVNREYGFFANIKNFAWEALFLLTIYSFAKNKKTAKRFFVRFQSILVSFGFIMSFISLLMFIFNYSYITRLANKQNPLRIGFVENRLFGAYADPNYAAVMAVIVILFSIYLFLNVYKNKIIKSLLVINVLLQIIYIGLSGSRNGLIVLLCVSAIFTFFNVYYLAKNAKRAMVTRVFISLLLSGIIAAIFFISVDFSKKSLSYVPEMIVSVDKKSQKEKIAIDQNQNSKTDLSREDIARSGDISNMRFTLWKSGIEIFKTSPLLGVSPKSIHDYAENEIPETYLAKTDLAVHNAYLNVLVCTGILGALFVGVFILWNIFKAIRYAFTNNILNSEFLYYMCAVVALSISGLFHNEIFFMTTSSPLVFWVFLGGMNKYMSKK